MFFLAAVEFSGHLAVVKCLILSPLLTGEAGAGVHLAPYGHLYVGDFPGDASPAGVAVVQVTGVCLTRLAGVEKRAHRDPGLFSYLPPHQANRAFIMLFHFAPRVPPGDMGQITLKLFS